MLTSAPALPIARHRVEILPDRQAWMAARSRDHRIGGSDVAQILDRSPFGGPWKFWMSRMQPSALRLDETEDQERGKRYERRVLEDYSEDCGIKVWMPRDFFGAPAGAEVVFHGAEPWMTMTLDALGFDALSGTWGVAEAKTSAMPEEWGPATEIPRWSAEFVGIIPTFVVLQSYWYLGISELPWLDVPALIISQQNRGLRIRRYRFHADRETQAQLVSAVSAWRQRHLIEGEPPPITPEAECRDFLGTRFGKSDTFREPAADELALAQELVALRASLKSGEQRAKVLESTLLERMGDAGGLYLPGLTKRDKRPVLRRVVVAAHEVAPFTIPGRHQPAVAYLKSPKE